MDFSKIIKRVFGSFLVICAVLGLITTFAYLGNKDAIFISYFIGYVQSCLIFLSVLIFFFTGIELYAETL